MKADAETTKAKPAGIPALAIWAGLMVFLSLDLILFGNCVIPTQEADPEPTPDGHWQPGAGATLPAGGYVELRRGLPGDWDLGGHAMMEYLPGDVGASNLLPRADTASADAFHGGDAIAVGLDMKRVLARSGSIYHTLQLGLNVHTTSDSESVVFYDVMAGYLFGKPRAYISPRLHVGWQHKPFLQVEIPMGLRTRFFHDHFALGMGINPAVFLVGGVQSIPFVWPYGYLEWRFGG